MKTVENSTSQIDSIDDMLNENFNIDASQSRSDGRPDGRPRRHRPIKQNLIQAGIANSKFANASDQALIDIDGDVQFDSPDEFMRAVAGQRETWRWRHKRSISVW